MIAEELIRGERVIQEPISVPLSDRFLVTGACGSIGSMVMDILAEFGVTARGVDWNEQAVFHSKHNISVDDFVNVRPQNSETVIHAAAFKHVGLGEDNPNSYWNNNAYKFRDWVKNMKNPLVYVSTDKASGTTIMGQSKKWGESYCKVFKKVAVRLVNVWGSAGSVGDIWSHKNPIPYVKGATRYFMQPHDAVWVIFQSLFMPHGVYSATGFPQFDIEELAGAWCDIQCCDSVEMELREGDAREEKLVSHDEVLVDTQFNHLGEVRPCWEQRLQAINMENMSDRPLRVS